MYVPTHHSSLTAVTGARFRDCLLLMSFLSSFTCKINTMPLTCAGGSCGWVEPHKPGRINTSWHKLGLVKRPNLLPAASTHSGSYAVPVELQSLLVGAARHDKDARQAKGP
jgi:hypothetical protein